MMPTQIKEGDADKVVNDYYYDGKDDNGDNDGKDDIDDNVDNGYDDDTHHLHQMLRESSLHFLKTKEQLTKNGRKLKRYKY